MSIYSFPVIELTDDQPKIIQVEGLLRLLLKHDKQLYLNHGKTVSQMANYGGLGWIEVLAILEARPVNSDDSEVMAKTVVLIKLEANERRVALEREALRLEDERRETADRLERARVLGLRPKFLEVTAHCSDLCSLTLLSATRETIVEQEDGYVPEHLGIGGDDDVELTIDLDTGMIVGWKRPSDTALRRFIHRATTDHDDDDDD
jgi:hypothetical protein